MGGNILVSTHSVDLKEFWKDPYPDLRRIQDLAPAVEVPELNAVLITRRDDIFEQEKRIEVFSSRQPEGLMTVLMGENMMRKDGYAHLAERKITFPALSPKTVRDVWMSHFEAAADHLLDGLEDKPDCDIMQDYAMPISAEALKVITGLTEMPTEEMDRVSQHMIDGVANFAGDPDVEARCHAATQLIDDHIDRRAEMLKAEPDMSLLSLQLAAGLNMEATRANVKLAISGGQNEPRDVIAGTVWALLTHPDQLGNIRSGEATYTDAFNEYCRWISPIGMSPRQIARSERVLDYDFVEGQRAFFMFGIANRDPRVFDDPDTFDLSRDTRKAIAFGAGPHFCAGAAASKALIADVALPKLFERFPDMTLSGEVEFGGWAFRGPLSLPVTLE